MCGIAGILNLRGKPVKGLSHALGVMNTLQQHRGPDDEGLWQSEDRSVGFAHRRLSIIDLSAAGHQPMVGNDSSVIVHNGEVYNHIELRESLSHHWSFHSTSDTEAILAAYAQYGADCVNHLRGMFAFSIWDGDRLFCARDRFGIKPFYYAVVEDLFVFSSEVKALLPFLPEIETEPEAFSEYVAFQFNIGEKTLFKHVRRLLPGHSLVVKNGQIKVRRYWDVQYNIDFDHSPQYFSSKLRELMDDSIRVHLRSDVPIGSYLSGGLDSSLIAILANRHDGANFKSFHGKFSYGAGYDESPHAHVAAESCGNVLYETDITARDFENHIEKVIYHLDYPVAGPGSFPQYMVSKMAAQEVKVVLGGQGGDEIFGGYARYLIAYFEQSIKAAIEGTYRNGNFVVTPESIIPNLRVLEEYKPLIKQFWSKGLFGPLDQRYFSLINRSADMANEIKWEELDQDQVFNSYAAIFNNSNNVKKEAYFDSMTHFDFKTLLPALLHVEDRMSMAHGLESRVPFLDHPLITFLATVPADVKFKDGQMKRLMRDTYADVFPPSILNRRDKMGFPVPLTEWFQSDLREFVSDLFLSEKARSRPFINSEAVIANLEKSGKFSRKMWGLFSLEIWQRHFHDQAAHYQGLL